MWIRCPDRTRAPWDPESGLYKARVAIDRLSGARESWLRLNPGFVGLIRRHLLHWRALTREERGEIYTEARDLLRQCAQTLFDA